MDGICLDKFFYESSFDTKKGISEIFKQILDPSLQEKILSNNKDLYNCGCGVILTRDQEYKFFKRYSYIKYRIKQIENWNTKESKKKSEIKNKVNQLFVIRDIITKCNTRLMVKPVFKFSNGDSSLFDDLMSNSYIHMLKSIEGFDYRKGFKFSTYFSNALYRNLIKDVMAEKNKKKHFEEDARSAEDSPVFDFHESQKDFYNKDFTKKLFLFLENKNALGNKNLLILKKYYGVCGEKRQTLREISKVLGLTTEGVRQIKLKTELFIQNNFEEFELKYDPVF